jgi:hypothetical protein
MQLLAMLDLWKEVCKMQDLPAQLAMQLKKRKTK